MGDPRDGQIITPDSMTMELRTAFRPQVAANLPSTAYAARFGPAELLIRVDGSALDVTRGDGPVDRRGRGAARPRRPPRPFREHVPPRRLTASTINRALIAGKEVGERQPDLDV